MRKLICWFVGCHKWELGSVLFAPCRCCLEELYVCARCGKERKQRIENNACEEKIL